MSISSALSPAPSAGDIVVRSLHDLGLAAWFGGSLAGVLGINTAADTAPAKRDRLRAADAGWARVGRLTAVAAGVHLAGATGMLFREKEQLLAQSAAGTTTAAKTALTVAAAATTAYCGVLGRKLDRATGVAVEGSTEPAPETPGWVEKVQRQLSVLQWVVPTLTGAVVVLNAIKEEQKRPGRVLSGVLQKPAKLLGVA